MLKIIPNLSKSVPISDSKLTRSNFDNVFSAFMLLNSLIATPYGAELSTVLAAIFNRLNFEYTFEPSLALDYTKSLRIWYIAHLRGEINPEHTFTDAQWSVKGNCPLILESALALRSRYLAMDPVPSLDVFDRFIFGMLTFDRIAVISTEPNYSTITSADKSLPVTAAGGITHLTEALARLGITRDSFKEEYKRQCKLFKYEIISTAGPNGQATWTAHSDTRAWMQAGKLAVQLHTFLSESHLVGIFEDMINTIPIATHDPSANKDVYLGRIHNILEWGGKNRSVAILDYWTQAALTPLHDTINHFLAKLPQDATFDQDRAVARLARWTADPNVKVYSYDLTAATDRLPIKLQQEILTTLTGSSSFSYAWAQILTGRKFRTPDGSDISYACGQPMGAKSSFPMLALTHHVIIQQAAINAKIAQYSEYNVLGDDGNITESSVATNYKAILQHLAVGLSDKKSIVHVDGARSAGEICKRLFIEGVEMTSLPVKLIAKVVTTGVLGPTLQNELVKRDSGLTDKTFWPFMKALLDTQSFDALYRMNLMPKSITGLIRSFAPLVKSHAEPSSWYKDVTVKETDLVNVYGYTVAVEELKRLDALIRNSDIISSQLLGRSAPISEASFPNNIASHTVLFATIALAQEESLKSVLSTVKTSTARHPVVLATTSEVKRITTLLTQLSSSDTLLSDSIRTGLLDQFRNSLVTIWSDKNAARGQQDRAILHKSTRNLESAIFDMKDATLEFTTVLQSLRRLWTVRFKLGDHLAINAVKSRVLMSSIQAQSDVDTYTTGFSFASRSSGRMVVKSNN